MASYQAPLEDMKFLLNDVFSCDQVWSAMDATSDVNSELASAVLSEAAKFVENELAPLNAIGDQLGCQLTNGQVKTPEGFKQAYQAFAQGGWQGLGGGVEYGGQGLPKMLTVCFEEMLWAANTSFTLYPILTNGASLLLSTHGSKELKDQYLKPMYEGRWAGTMCLTEPHAGSDLGIIRTKAEASSGGKYLVTGTKIFISGGEQDLTENIIHLVLAKLPDAPKGAKGISLFLVPKIKLDETGSLGQMNSVSCGSIEHKMGIKGASTCVMNFDQAEAYLVGEINSGLAAMFTMMNYERVSIGIQGLGIAEWAYQNALSYAKERRQGRGAEAVQNPDDYADSIMAHGDVRRMLLDVKANTEASRALAILVSSHLDIAKYHACEKTRNQSAALVELLTPLTKAYLTDLGMESCLNCQMVLGGHGYISEWGLEQAVRDVRIAQIYEGTNGIQSLDLIARKVVRDGAAKYRLFVGHIEEFVSAHGDYDELKYAKQMLQESVSDLSEITQWILTQSKNDANFVGAIAVHYLHLFGLTTFAYLWYRMAVCAMGSECGTQFKQSKIETAQYYFHKILPKRKGLEAMIRQGSAPVMAMDVSLF